MLDNLTRRGLLAKAETAAAAVAVDAASPKPPPADEARPNVLWICTDQQRYDTIRSLGNRHIRTPNLDKLVETGVAFTHAHCQSPICTPSRASFLTGMYPDTVHGCINGNEHWAHAAPLVTKTLADAGYDCGLAGKLHLSSAQNRIEPRPKDGYRVFQGPQTCATMIRTRRNKLVTHHGHDLGELFDLEKDPGELENRWGDAKYAPVRFDLLRKSFDALALAVDTGPRRIGRF